MNANLRSSLINLLIIVCRCRHLINVEMGHLYVSNENITRSSIKNVAAKTEVTLD